MDVHERKLIFVALLALCILVAVDVFIYSSKTAEKTLAINLSFQGDKNITTTRMALQPKTLVGKNALLLNYDLHGVCLLNGPASAIILNAVSGRTYTVSLAYYGKNCADGEQTVKIPFQDFGITEPIEDIRSLSFQFWYPTSFSFEIQKVNAFGFFPDELDNYLANVITSQKKELKTSRALRQKTLPHLATTSTTNTLLTTTTPVTAPIVAVVTSTSTLASVSTPIITSTTTKFFWSIRSVSSMKETKDKVCGQDSSAFINAWLDKAVELGVNYVAVETPYDDPSCGSSIAYTKAWVDAIHARGLHVWHRHAPLAFEGIYSTAKDSSKNYLTFISDYIKAHPTFFKAGDIFTPIPEPQNGGISGVTYCPQNICIFSDAANFNKWLRDAMTTSEAAFASIGLGGKMNIGYYGFDGFVAWGDNNPDWHGILEDATVTAMGNITIDHYPEIVGDTMENDLNELQAKYPHTPIVIGEWGTITGGDTMTQVKNSMQAAMRQNVIGFNYWHLGLGGNESLINDDMTNKIDFDTVKSFFTQ